MLELVGSFFKNDQEFRIFIGRIRSSLRPSLVPELHFNGKLITSSQRFEYLWKWKRGKLFIHPTREANAHILIVGSSGYGKSTLLKGMIRDIADSGKNAIIFDGHNEHEQLVRSLGGRALNALYSNINILSLDGMTIPQRMEELTGLISDVYNLGYLQKADLNKALFYTYRKCCTDMRSNTLTREPTIHDLLNEFSIFIRNARTQGERNRLEHIRQRLNSLSKSVPVGTHISIDSLREGINSFSLSGIDSMEAKIVYMHELVTRLYSSMKRSDRERGIGTYIIIDESRFLIEKASQLIGSFVSESRKFGFAVILVSNSATVLPKEIVANASTFIAFHTNEPGEISYIGSTIARGNNTKAAAVKSMLEKLKKHHAIVVSYLNDALVVNTPEARPQGKGTRGRLLEEGIAAAMSLARKPIAESRLSEAVSEEALEEIKGSTSFESIPADGDTWIMKRNKALSLEHELSVKRISSVLSEIGIRHSVTRGKGPDIIAYIGNGRVAIEYETGKKRAPETAKMLEKRKESFARTILIANDSKASCYKRFESDNLSIVPLSEFLSSKGTSLMVK